MLSLNTRQQEVVECDSNCLVVACPGSGKSRVIIEKSERTVLLDPVSNILILSFSADSAREIKERLIKKAEQEQNEKLRALITGNVGTGTFHSVGLHQLNAANIRPAIIKKGQMRENIARAIRACGANMSIEEAWILIEEAKLNPEYDPGNDIQGKLFVVYTQLCERSNVIDFTDMLAITVRMMKEGSLPPKNCQYLMIDEAQDLDPLQYAWSAEHFKNGAIGTVVGDDDQSIYRFRRALGYEGMLRFQQEFDAEIITLDTNYRCNSEIIEPAKTLISLNQSRVEKQLIADRGKGGTVKVWHCGGPDAEAEMVVNAILESCAGNEVPEPRIIKDKNGGEFTYVYQVGILPGQWAIFARNNYNLRTITSALKAAGIPYHSKVPDIFDDRPVCFVLGLMRSIITKERSGYDFALHYAGLESEVLERLHQDFGEDFDSMFNKDVTFEKYGGRGTVELLTDFAKNVRGWKKNATKNFAANLAKGIFDWFRAHHRPIDAISDPKKAQYAARIELKKLDTAERLMMMQKGGILERIERLRAKPDPNVTSVNIGTLHSSKGLEFNHVWLASVDDGVIPDQKEDSLENIEEERRLFYVGMTRAKDYLYISSGETISSFIADAGLKPQISPNFQKKKSPEDQDEGEEN